MKILGAVTQLAYRLGDVVQAGPQAGHVQLAFACVDHRLRGDADRIVDRLLARSRSGLELLQVAGLGGAVGDRLAQHDQDRKSVVEGKSVSVRVGLGGRRKNKKKKITKK